MLLLDLIKEYLLILYLKLLPCFKTIPENWNHGEKGDVVLVPGLHETNFFLYFVANHINELGYKIHTIPNFSSIETIEQIHNKLEDKIKSMQKKDLILLSYSKGGIVAKHFIDNSKHTKDIKLSISLATPYLGSKLAVTKLHNIHELKPNSHMIKKINAHEQHLEKIINFYPKFDNHVIPNKSLILKGAKNIKINVNGHTRILVSEEVKKRLTELL